MVEPTVEKSPDSKLLSGQEKEASVITRSVTGSCIHIGRDGPSYSYLHAEDVFLVTSGSFLSL